METNKEPQIKSENKIEYDKCVFCGATTPYPTIMGIDQRYCYIEGAGQLCLECFEKFNNRK